MLDDTSLETKKLIYKKLSQMTKEQRLAHFFELCTATRELALAGILHRNPGIGVEQARKAFAALTLGSDFVEKHMSEKISL